LSTGINLAQLNTPMTRQSNAVYGITSNRTQTRYFLWRQLEVGLSYMSPKETSTVIKDYQRAEEDLIRMQHNAAKPVAHRFQLSPVTN